MKIALLAFLLVLPGCALIDSYGAAPPCTTDECLRQQEIRKEVRRQVREQCIRESVMSHNHMRLSRC